MKNIAFVDGQNLHLGTKENGWLVDYEKFRTYLRDKYKVKEAYYFFGFLDDNQQVLYRNVQRAGFIIVFKEHHQAMAGKKKGNVDADIIFEMMKALIEEDFDKVVLISGDGDYKKTVNYLIEKNKFLKILFPNKKFASSLYKKLGNQFQVSLDSKDIKNKIAYKKKKVA